MKTAWMEEQQGRIVYSGHGMTKWRRIGQSCGFTLSMVKQIGSA
jgi:hypothetical protein